MDELHTFIECKDRNLTPEIKERNPNAGSIWPWVTIDADTELVPCVALGSRNAADAQAFIAISHRACGTACS